VVIELPENIAKLEGEFRFLSRANRTDLHAVSDHLISQAAIKIKNAEKPVFLIGAGAARDGASDHVRKLVGYLSMLKNGDLPVMNTFQAKGTVVGSSTVGFMDKSGIEPILESDLIIAIGYGQHHWQRDYQHLFYPHI